MHAPTLEPAQTDHDVVVIPEAAPAHGRTRDLLARPAAVIAMVIVAAMVGGLVVYTWEQTQIDDAQAVTATQVTLRLAAQQQAAAAATEVAVLEQRLEGLQGKLENARRRAGTLLGRRAELVSQLGATQVALDQSRGRLREIVGAPLAPGRYIGYVSAVGTGSTPARVVVDLGQWFRGQSATDAARLDGVIGPDETVSRYLRNTDAQWRVLPLGPTAGFTLVRWRGALYPTVVDPVRFAQIQANPWPADVRAAQDPYWITVGSDGTVMGLVEQRY
jgi:hypothetical protein